MVWLGVCLFIAVVWAVLVGSQRRHQDPEDQTVLDLDQIAGVSNLTGPGPFGVFVFRQSGNPHQDPKVYETADAAIAAAVSTFRRSQIPFARIRQNTEAVLEFVRPYHDARGRKEGKKVGWIVIERLD